MKKNYFILLIAYSLIVGVLLWGCGGDGPGSPGSKGTEDTGVTVDATVVGYYDGEEVYSVDAFQSVCDPGPPTVYEYIADHQAIVTITARLINPNTTFQPGNLYVEKYTVEYRRSTDSIGAPPIETDIRYKTIVITPPTGTGTTTITDTLILVDLMRKEKYREDVLSGQYSSSYGLAYLNNYTATYIFEGKNEFGEEFKFEAQMDFTIGNFDNC